VTTPNDEQASGLARLLTPTTTAGFFADVFEVEPLHVERKEASYFSALFGRADLEAALHASSTITGYVSMAKDGALVDDGDLFVERTKIRARYTGRPPANVVDPRAVAAHYDRGYTLFIKDVGLFSPRVHTLCNDIQRETLIYVQANAYLTPAHHHGFGLHYDTHDTLVLQIEGTKTWNVYKPRVELPIESQPSPPGLDGTVLRSFDLRAGDTFYLPRGFPHECTAGAEPSLHLTLALLPVRVVELAEAALRIAAVSDVELRRALKQGWQDAKEMPARLSALLIERLRTALTESCLRAARELVVNELFATTRTGGDAAISSTQDLQGLYASTRIAIRSDAPFLLRDHGANVDLVEAGKVTTLPAGCAKAINALLTGAMTVAAIESMLPGSGIALVRLLVLDGIATILPS
jgi:Cupin superfamily protein